MAGRSTRPQPGACGGERNARGLPGAAQKLSDEPMAAGEEASASGGSNARGAARRCAVERLPCLLRARRTVSVRCLLRGGCNVCAGGLTYPHFRSRSEQGIAQLCRRHLVAAGFRRLARGRAERDLGDAAQRAGLASGARRLIFTTAKICSRRLRAAVVQIFVKIVGRTPPPTRLFVVSSNSGAALQRDLN